MCFICSGHNKKFFESLFKMIYQIGDEFVFYEDGLSLLSNVTSAPSEEKLIILDYNLYKGFTDFIFDILYSKNKIIPLILIENYTDKKTVRLNRWLAENEFHYDVQNMHLLIPLLSKIVKALESEELKSIPMDEKKEKKELKLKVKSKRVNFLEQLKIKYDFPPVLYNLLSFLYDNRCREVSIEEIARYLNIKNDSVKKTRNEAYSYISRLKKYMDCIPLTALELLRTRTGFYKLFIH